MEKADKTAAELPKTLGLMDATCIIVGIVIGSGIFIVSAIAIIPLQDVFGWTDRINTPALVSDENWTWRVRWQVDRLDDIEEAQERTKALAEWTRASGR